MTSNAKSLPQSSPDWLVGGGEMGAHMRARLGTNAAWSTGIMVADVKNDDALHARQPFSNAPLVGTSILSAL